MDAQRAITFNLTNRMWLSVVYLTNRGSVVCTLIDNEYASLSIRVQTTLNHNIKDNERNLCQDLLTIEDSDLKVHALHYVNELLVRVRLDFRILTRAARSFCI